MFASAARSPFINMSNELLALAKEDPPNGMRLIRFSKLKPVAATGAVFTRGAGAASATGAARRYDVLYCCWYVGYGLL